jgi:hypothetical protein
MAKEKWAKAYVKANIRETEKGYHCKMPDLVAYPAGAVTMMIGKTKFLLCTPNPRLTCGDSVGRTSMMQVREDARSVIPEPGRFLDHSCGGVRVHHALRPENRARRRAEPSGLPVRVRNG